METLILLLLWSGVLGRLSSFPDLFLKQIGYDLPDRISTKIIFLFIYILLILYIAINNRKFIRDLIINRLYSKILNKDNKSKRLILFSGLIIISSIVSAIFSLDKTQGIFGVFYYVILLSIPLFFGLLSPSFLGKFVKHLIIINIIVFIVAIVQLYSFSEGGASNIIVSFFDNNGGFMPISFFVAGTENIYLRPSSLLVDPNFSAVFSASSIAMFLGILFSRKHSQINNIALILGVISSLLNLLLTGSRTGLLMLFTSIALYFLIILIRTLSTIINKSLKRKVYSVSLPVIIYDTYLRIKDALNLEDSSTLDHIHFAMAGVKAFVSSPVWGVGIGCYSKYYELNIDSNSLYATPHSAYFRIIAEMGVLGTVSFMLYFGYFIVNFIRDRFIIGVILLLTMFVGNITYDFMMTPWFWLFIGFMIYNYNFMYRKKYD